MGTAEGFTGVVPGTQRHGGEAQQGRKRNPHTRKASTAPDDDMNDTDDEVIGRVAVIANAAKQRPARVEERGDRTRTVLGIYWTCQLRRARSGSSPETRPDSDELRWSWKTTTERAKEREKGTGNRVGADKWDPRDDVVGG